MALLIMGWILEVGSWILGCGIAGRRPTDGIAGQAMSVTALMLFGVSVVVATTLSSP
jgi:hypothetical protein